MKTTLSTAIAALAVLLPPCVADAQPQQWELQQNDPNPFCGVTAIRFAVPEIAEVHLVVWSPDGTEVIRDLFGGLVNVGFYEILWDQTDEDGLPVPDGDYPYQLRALDPESEGVLFEAWLVATVECDPTPTEFESWGRIRERYARRR